MSQKYKVYVNNSILIINENWKDFCSKYKIVNAAGGIVFNDTKLLMIFRNGLWDLPKGKVEPDENLKECAIREVEEETGVKDLTIKGKEIISYHIYSTEFEDILKKTTWYIMNTKYDKKLIPQIDEGIEKASWVSIQEINHKLNNSFKSIEDIIRKVM